MALTNFPQGISSFGMPVVGGGPVLTTGKVFFVHSGNGADSSDRGASPDNPFKTLAYAVGRTRANKGDVIIVMPGHTENIASAGAITLANGGVTIIGLGNGAERPTFTVTAAAGTFAVSGANCKIVNCVFDLTSAASVGTCFNITGADFGLERSRFVMSNVTNQATRAITLGAGANRASVVDCTFLSPNGSTDAIYSAQALDEVTVRGCRFYGSFASGGINNATNAFTNLLFDSNTFNLAGSAQPAITLASGATGTVQWNTARGVGWSAVTTPFGAGGTAALGFHQNFALDNVAGSSLLAPAVGTIS